MPSPRRRESRGKPLPSCSRAWRRERHGGVSPSHLVAAVPIAVVLALAAIIVWSVGRKLPDGAASVQRAAGPAIAEPAVNDGAVPRASVAVMPLANPTGDPSLRYLGDGIADELIYALARVKGLTVPARTSSFAYREGASDRRRRP
jgi:adenylate cyclase